MSKQIETGSQALQSEKEALFVHGFTSIDEPCRMCDFFY